MEMRDKYYHKAKKFNYRARSAFKLMDINKKYNIINKNDDVLDLGCWPGGWLQVARKLTKARVVGIDINEIKPIENVEFYKGDINHVIKLVEGKFDVVLSDMAPKTTGNINMDTDLSIELAESALKIAEKKLNEKGNFVVKVFQGKDFQRYYNLLKKKFSFVKSFKPMSSRKRSKETYVICKGFLLDKV